MEQAVFLLLGVLTLYCAIDFLWRLFKGPYRCSCGYETYNPDEALRHQGHAKHTVE